MLFFTAWRFIQRRMTVDLARESSDARKQSPGNRPSRPTNAGPDRAPPGPPLVSGCFDWAPCWETVNPLLHPVARRFVVSGNARAGFNVHEKNHKLFCLWRDVTHEVRSTSQTTARQGEHSRSSQLPRCIYSRENHAHCDVTRTSATPMQLCGGRVSSISSKTFRLSALWIQNGGRSLGMEACFGREVLQRPALACSLFWLVPSSASVHTSLVQEASRLLFG